MSALRPIALFPRNRKGLERLSDVGQRSPVTVMDASQAFQSRWENDEHFVGYLASDFDPSDSDDVFYRLRKKIIPEIRQSGADVVMNYVGIEWDCPNHDRWSPDHWRTFQTLLAQAEERGFGPVLHSASWFYTTGGGARWVFRLATPIPVTEVEPLIRGLIRDFCAAGINVDWRCKDWTRIFRLPRVFRIPEGGTRDQGRWSDEGAFYVLEENLSVSLELRDISPASNKDIKADETDRDDETEVEPTRIDIREQRPDQDAAKLLLRDLKGKDTEFGKAARSWLKGQASYPYLFEGAVLSLHDGDSRHEWLVKWVNNAAYYISSIDPIPTASQLFSLFVGVVEQFDERDTGPCWLDELWNIVVHSWSRELGRQQERKVEEQKAAEQAQLRTIELSETITQTVKSWAGGVVPEDPAEAWDWIRGRMIAVTKDTGHHYVMTSSGYYCKDAVKKNLLVPQVLNLGMSDAIPLVRMNAEGEDRRATYDEIVADNAIAVSRIEMRAQIEGAYLDDPASPNPVLVLPSFRRNPKLEPCFNADVDLWIRSLAGFSRTGESLYEKLCKQIGLFLAFERGAVCAMSFRIRSGAGKKLLAHGFMETLERPELATGRDLVDRNNPGLLWSPFIVVNEGWDMVGSFSKAPDMARKLITGDTVTINQKYQPEITTRFPYRLILTANDDELLLGLSKGDLAPDAREAIALRIQHYEPGDGPVDLLRSRGEWKWTKGWIGADGSGSSDYIVARHFLWLYDKYGKNAEPTDRHGLLMAGDPTCSSLDIMRTQGGSTPMVVEALIKRLNENMLKVDGSDGIFIDKKEKKLFVTPAPIIEYARKHPESFDRIKPRSFSTSLKGLMAEGVYTGEKTKSLGGYDRKWIEIDVDVLLSEAEKYGWSDSGLRSRIYGTNGVAHVNGTAH